jgi:hypothetical protein
MVYETKSEYNAQSTKFMESASEHGYVTVSREIIKDGFFSQIERISITSPEGSDVQESLFYDHSVSFSLMKASGEFDLDSKEGVIAKLTQEGKLSGLDHTGKWVFSDRIEVSHKTTSFKIDTDAADASVSPMEHAFYFDRDSRMGEFRLTFGGLLLVEQDRSRVEVGKVRSDGFVSVSETGVFTLPEQNVSISHVGFERGDGSLRAENILFLFQELEDNNFVTINQEFSVASVSADVPSGEHKATNLNVKGSLRHLDRAGYDLIRSSVDVDVPSQKLAQVKQGAMMIAAKGFAFDINDVSVTLDGGQSGLSGTVSIKPVDLRETTHPKELLPYLGGDMALTIDSQLIRVHPQLNGLVRQGIASGLLTLDKDGNPAMFAELNSGRLIVNGKPMM